MQSELQKLRIDKSQKAKRNEKSSLPTVLIVLVLIGVSAAAAWWYSNRRPTYDVTVMSVAVATAGTAEADRVVQSATGYVMAAHKIELASKVVGRVAWVGVEMADRIKKDEVLVRLEDDEYKARVAEQQGLLDNAKAKLLELRTGSRPQEIAQAQAGVDEAKAELATADRNYRRLKELEGSNSISRQELNDAETLVDARTAAMAARQQIYELAKAGPRAEAIAAQEATVRQLEATLALSMVDLNNTVIRSTIEGTVLERNVEVGEFVTTGFVGDRGAKGYVVSIADLQDLRVELDIPQGAIAKIFAGQPCKIITDAYPDRQYAGVVDLISPEANRQKATVLVRVKVQNPDELLKPDMNATVSLLSEKPAPASGPSTQRVAAQTSKPLVRIPLSAIRDDAVFVIESGKAVKRPVRPGNAAGNQVDIREGLMGGEELILNPPPALVSGDGVRGTKASN